METPPRKPDDYRPLTVRTDRPKHANCIECAFDGANYVADDPVTSTCMYRCPRCQQLFGVRFDDLPTREESGRAVDMSDIVVEYSDGRVDDTWDGNQFQWSLSGEILLIFTSTEEGVPEPVGAYAPGVWAKVTAVRKRVGADEPEIYLPPAPGSEAPPTVAMVIPFDRSSADDSEPE